MMALMMTMVMMIVMKTKYGDDDAIFCKFLHHHNSTRGFPPSWCCMIRTSLCFVNLKESQKSLYVAVTEESR